MIEIEVCCGSVEDVEIASQFPLASIELNSALSLGGLTPSLSTLVLSKERTDIPIITMVRARPGNFTYSPLEIETMYSDASLLLDNGADGIAFGFVTEDYQLDEYHTKVFTKLAHSRGRTAVFHRAFDCLVNPMEALVKLHELGVDRLLSSGQHLSAITGIAQLKKYQALELIKLVAGAGITPANYQTIVQETGITYLHGSFSEPIINKPSPTEVSFESPLSRTSEAQLSTIFRKIEKKSTFD
ncbi:MAG: copper homeostasis protein CutC [Erysipelothrix sp.]|nr:copper homeostasis protein CutC [Erysipelothrix sp.]